MKAKCVPKRIIDKAKKIKLIAMDVDGVLTGGEIIIYESGKHVKELKFWNVRDRMGFSLLRSAKSDLKLAWITGRYCKHVADQAKELKVESFTQDCMDKATAMKAILKEFSLKPEQVLYIGDDLVDVPVLKMVGLGIAPSDAIPEALKVADYITNVSGGKGVLREVAELVLKARGLWAIAAAKYL
jgi:3-deoxy-D-manno-octulosonate 8-phosphate phosphatase (KDO 8-P phosphatase)